MEEREQTGVSHGSNREKGSPTISIRLFVGYGLQLTLRLFVVGGACLDLPKHECTHETHHTHTHIQTSREEIGRRSMTGKIYG